MNKFLLVFMLIIFALPCIALAAGDADEAVYNNKGYAEHRGMVAIFAELPHYISKDYDNFMPGGGFLIYGNLLNKFWGNLGLGVTAEYIGGKFNKEGRSGYMHTTPMTFDIMYLTSSDLINLWAGVGFSLNVACFNMDGMNSLITKALPGVTAFAGIEYIISKSGNWGLFFEFRYTYSMQPDLGIGISADTQHMRYALGVSYHF